MSEEGETLDIRALSRRESAKFALRLLLHVTLGGRLHIAYASVSRFVFFGMRLP